MQLNYCLEVVSASASGDRLSPIYFVLLVSSEPPQVAMQLNHYREVSLYKGIGDSTAWQEGSHTIAIATPETPGCDGTCACRWRWCG